MTDELPRPKPRDRAPFLLPEIAEPNGRESRAFRPKSVRRREIKDKLDTLMSAPVFVACRVCVLFFPDDAVGNCPVCARPLTNLPPGNSRETLMLESLASDAIRNPGGNSTRVLMGYRYGNPISSLHVSTSEREVASQTEVTLRVIESTTVTPLVDKSAPAQPDKSATG